MSEETSAEITGTMPLGCGAAKQDLVNDFDLELNFKTGSELAQWERESLGLIDGFVLEDAADSGLLGHGGMGIVFRARQERLDRQVAVKVLLSKHQTNPAVRECFLAEARTTARLQHPGIVPVYAIGGSEKDRPFFAMKIVEGSTLAEILIDSEDTPWEESKLLRVFVSVCEAVGYAHDRGVLHLDLKPSNVMVGAFGEVHVLDWGLSCQLASNTSREATATTHSFDDHETDLTLSQPKRFGTLSYLPPEQASGQPLTTRTDVYGLGAVLCQILTGQPPHLSERRSGLVRDAVKPDRESLHKRLNTCATSKALVDLTKRCLSTDPAQRPPDALAVAREMSQHIENSMRHAEHDLCRFFEISLDLFCIAGADGYFKRVNSNFTRVLGYTEQELISKPFLEFVHQEDIEKTIAIVQAMSRGQPCVDFTNRYRHRDGHYLKLNWTAKVDLDDNAIFAVARQVNHDGETI